jgi:hypothetical protein
MMVTDVARAVDKIQFTLNRIGYGQTHDRRPPLQIKKELVKESTIYEEDEVREHRTLIVNAEIRVVAWGGGGGIGGATPSRKHLVGKMKDFVSNFYIVRLIKFNLPPSPVDVKLLVVGEMIESRPSRQIVFPVGMGRK